MKKSLVLRGVCLPVVALLCCLVFVGYTSAQAKTTVKTYHYNVHTINNPDSGTCGNNWAIDTFNRTFIVRSNHPNTIQEEVKGNFVTVAGKSPGACNKIGTDNGNIVGAGIRGKLVGEETVIVTGGTFDSTKKCNAKTPCDTTAEFVALFYGAGATIKGVPSFEFNYTSEHGHWQNANVEEGNIGDITGSVDKDGD